MLSYVNIMWVNISYYRLISVYYSIRDKTEEKLLEIAIEKNMPLLGICKGMQMLNVLFKGKLIKNIKKQKNDAIEHVNKNHLVTIVDDRAATLLGKKFEVNSYHNQGISLDFLSDELKEFAIAPDEIIEGFYHPDLPIAGIQWHPERPSPDEKTNEKIIRAFINRELYWEK